VDEAEAKHAAAHGSSSKDEHEVMPSSTRSRCRCHCRRSHFRLAVVLQVSPSHLSPLSAAFFSLIQSLVTYMRQSEHGLTHVELCAIVLAFLATAGDKALRERVEQLLNQQDIPISALQRTLRQYVDMMGESSNEAVGHTKKVLQALAAMLDE